MVPQGGSLSRPAPPEEAPAEVDVVVVGGGPAGCAAALTLLRYSDATVLVAERSRYEGYRVGETLPPGAGPLLAYLGVSHLLEQHLPAPATVAVWGGDRPVTRDFLFTGRGHGWHLDRSRFDAALAGAVADVGGVVCTATTAQVVDRDGGRWVVCLTATSPGGTRLVLARALVDATGRRAGIARRFGAVREAVDTLTGVVHLIEPPVLPAGAATTLVEATPEGWWYSAPLPDGRLVAAFMTDAATVRRDRLGRGGAGSRHLDAAPHTSARLGGSRASGAPLLRPARSQHVTPVAGDGWVAVGDAAAAFDPLASMGIGYALGSGAAGARALHAHLGGDTGGLDGYTGSVTDHFRTYLELRRRHYAAEDRWPDQAFWIARRTSPRGTA